MWNNLRSNLPKSWNTTRIENRFGGGIPDVHVCAESLPFWIELKVTKTNRVNVSAHQVAWNFAYCQSGGVSFYLVKALERSNLYLFDGVHGSVPLVGVGPGGAPGGDDRVRSAADRPARSSSFLAWARGIGNPGQINLTGVRRRGAPGHQRRH